MCVQNGKVYKQFSLPSTRMAGKSTLREFLDNHRAEGVWTHTALNGGKYFIGDDDLETFYNLYVEELEDNGYTQHLTEKTTDIGSPRVDFDFIYEPSVQKHQHTREQTMQFVKLYMNELSKYLVFANADVYIMEKRKPTLDTKKNRMKSGIHIVVPSLKTHKFVEKRVRTTLLKSMGEIFAGLPVTESWDKVYDEAVVNRSVPWTLYGSRKPDSNARPYLVSYIVNYENGEVSIVDKVPPLSLELMKTLSLRSSAEATPLTEEAQKLYSGLQLQPDVRISGGRAVTPARGRQSTRSEKTSSRASSPMARMMRPLEPEEREYYKSHVMNLSPKRAEDYSDWVNVGICLHNIHVDLLDVFLDFSSQNEQKYNEADCIQKWNSLTFRNDGQRMGPRTLLFWSRTDNPEGYLEIENTNCDRLLQACCSGTEHDVASYINAKYRDCYKCSDFGKNVWYRWSGHVWSETDRGVDLQLKLSREVAGDFFKKASKIQTDMAERNLMNCSSEGKGDCGFCEYCQLEKQREGFNKIYMKLKTTKFKDNVMKECRELFFDELFTNKVDSNLNLIAFNNGVLELDTFEFREGKPEDYISFSTRIDYEVDKKYYEYPEWGNLERFIKQVLPDAEVREYFMKHLSTCLIGGNQAQKFHILTGSGSNGKSMLMNLTGTALGDYAAVVPISLFTQKRGKSAAAAPEVARLKGRRFVTMQEPDERIALNTGLMKELTSCEKIYARDLFKSGMEFEIQAKFHLACNDKPEINTTDGGTWRRLVVINYTSKFVDTPTESFHYPIDESIKFLVNKPEWAMPFLNYLVHLLKEGKGFHKLKPPSKVLEYTSDYRNENDAIAKFITEKTTKYIEGEQVIEVSKQILRSTFRSWKITNEYPNLNPAELEKRLNEVYGPCKRTGWTGFKIVDG